MRDLMHLQRCENAKMNIVMILNDEVAIFKLISWKNDYNSITHK